MFNPIDVTVVSGTSVTIMIPEVALVNGKVDKMKFCLTKADRAQLETAVGTEPVSIQAGAAGTPIPLLTRIGNVFYADRLELHYNYRIAYANNGPSGPHFLNLNTPKPGRAYDPNNGATA